MNRVLVKILSSGRIPFVSGTGPILKPIWLLEEEVNTLVKLGYRIERVEIQPAVVVETPVQPVQQEVVEEVKPVVEVPVVEEKPQTFVTSEFGVYPDKEEQGEVQLAEVSEEELEVPTSVEEEVTNEDIEVELETVEEELAEIKEEAEELLHEEEVPEVEEESTPEVVINDEQLSADAYYTSEFLTKKKSMTILEARGIEFDKKENATDLTQKVLDSNPEVE
jgi:hypothetical protein